MNCRNKNCGTSQRSPSKLLRRVNIKTETWQASNADILIETVHFPDI
jgi:hypothetical protein